MADAQRSAAKPGPRPAGRLYVKGVFTGYRRNHHQQQEHTALLKLEGVFDQKAANFYVGKRACYLYKAHKKVTKPGKSVASRTRAIWGRVTRVHGSGGTVRAKFHHNLPPNAIGKRIRVLLYPSNI